MPFKDHHFMIILFNRTQAVNERTKKYIMH